MGSLPQKSYLYGSRRRPVWTFRRGKASYPRMLPTHQPLHTQTNTYSSTHTYIFFYKNIHTQNHPPTLPPLFLFTPPSPSLSVCFLTVQKVAPKSLKNPPNPTQTPTKIDIKKETCFQISVSLDVSTSTYIYARLDLPIFTPT